MKVLKFGGTSVGSALNILKIIEIVKAGKEQQIVVVSAFSKVTNLLTKAAQMAAIKKSSYLEIVEEIKTIHVDIIRALFQEQEQVSLVENVQKKIDKLQEILHGVSVINELSPKSEAAILSQGELLSSEIITAAFNANAINACRKDARELFETNADFTHATVNFDQSNQKINDYVSTVPTSVIVIPGFIAATSTGETTLLGRGGSDYSAAILAAALNAKALEIWTDVSGMFTANPTIVKSAMPISQISYEEAMELSHFGAKVLYPPTIHPVLRAQIPIYIKNTTKPDELGTLISKNSKDKKNPVKGISHIENVSLITLEGSGMVGVPGFSKRLFETLAYEGINVKLITQASSEHSICIGIDDANASRAKHAIDQCFEFEILKNKIKPLIVELHLSIIAIVGDQMKSHQGISGKMFGTLGKNNVNIRAIAQGASEKNISAVIAQKDVKKALNSLHEVFFKDDYKQINLFITGVGNVGEKLLTQIQQQDDFLKNNLHIHVRVVGLSNSRRMCFDENGLDLTSWQDHLTNSATSEKTSLRGFFDRVVQLNLRNSIFVDITANESVAKTYSNYLKQRIAVVACNKIACAASYKEYFKLKELSLRYNTPFLFETNVGAGLPVIDTLNNLIASGDKIVKIQAVLSGSLNFIFNNFKADQRFIDVVKLAAAEGYTEPDPRIDLSGIDVARKILILARESGCPLELEQIKNESFLTPADLSAPSVADFYAALDTEDEHYNALLQSADAHGTRLKYVASFVEGKAQVGLQEIPPDHPFYNLEGKDNIVMYYTERYPEQPLIIKGAGAGAEVTASGLFADIIKIANR
ncbi:bifunctional aspartate kinase/homoserine dehydrogenase I [Flavobacteriaceae bacterium F08102]|nr:bifunctional aspartate kinase/homoserine dehydrogenase I [Flavobacteriaceae bacterium F08102]